MKKYLCLLLVSIMLIGLSGCINTPDASDGSGGTTTTTTTTNTTTTTRQNTTTTTTPTPITAQTDGTAMTDDEARNLCVAKMKQAYQIGVWYMSMDYPLDIEMLPAGTAVTFLDGTPYTLDHEYYRLADSLPEADRAVTTTAVAFKQYIETVYTAKAIADEYYHSSTWVVYQGEVYRVAAEGIWRQRSTDTIRVINKGTDAITFTIDGWEDEPTLEYTLRYIDGNWKFDKLV